MREISKQNTELVNSKRYLMQSSLARKMIEIHFQFAGGGWVGTVGNYPSLIETKSCSHITVCNPKCIKVIPTNIIF